MKKINNNILNNLSSFKSFFKPSSWFKYPLEGLTHYTYFIFNDDNIIDNKNMNIFSNESIIFGILNETIENEIINH